jgi:hypothetical protein
MLNEFKIVKMRHGAEVWDVSVGDGDERSRWVARQDEREVD